MERKRIIDQIVCSFLYHRASHGYEIYEILNQNNIEKFMDFSKATIYNSLKRLEKNMMLTSTVVENDNKPAKTVYQLNDTGKVYLTELVEESLISCAFETIFVSNIGYHFHHLLDYNRLMTILEEKLERNRAIEEHLSPKVQTCKELNIFHQAVILEANVQHTQAEIYKLEKIIEKYKTDKEYLKSLDKRVKTFTEMIFNKKDQIGDIK